MEVDHIVISVTNLDKSVKFYTAFLGKPKITKFDASWNLGATKLFLTKPYIKKHRKFDKNNLGLNHIALQVKSLTELKKLEAKLSKAKIKHSKIQPDKYNPKNLFLWFDDPDKIRLEFYLRQ